jgi:hypothetical protein
MLALAGLLTTVPLIDPAVLAEADAESEPITDQENL